MHALQDTKQKKGFYHLTNAQRVHINRQTHCSERKTIREQLKHADIQEASTHKNQ